MKETLDEITAFVKFSVEIMFHLEVEFIRDTYDCSSFFERITNFIARISFIGENFFIRKVNAGK